MEEIKLNIFAKCESVPEYRIVVTEEDVHREESEGVFICGCDNGCDSCDSPWKK